METHLRGEAEEKGGRAVRDLGLRDMSIRGEQRGRRRAKGKEQRGRVGVGV